MAGEASRSSDTGEPAGHTGALEPSGASEPTKRLGVPLKNALEAMAEAERARDLKLGQWLLEIAAAITAEDIDEELLEVPWEGLSWYQQHALRRCAMSVQSWLSQPQPGSQPLLPTNAIIWLWNRNIERHPPRFGFRTYPM